MVLPIAPIAGAALRYGAIALAAYALARHAPPGRTDQRAEDALDDLSDGACVHRPREGGQINAAGRTRRVIRIGRVAVRVDAAALGRLKIHRV